MRTKKRDNEEHRAYFVARWGECRRLGVSIHSDKQRPTNTTFALVRSSRASDEGHMGSKGCPPRRGEFSAKRRGTRSV